MPKLSQEAFICATAWARTAVNDDARELLELGRTLYERLGTVAGHLDALGGALRRSVTAYNKAVGSMENRLLVTARSLETLGEQVDSPMLISADAAQVRSFTAPELTTEEAERAGIREPVGTTVEWYDFFLYATAASLVFNTVFFPHQSGFVGTLLTFATFAVGFVVRPIGGVVFGHIGDRIGRKKTLALTMVMMGLATALMGVLPTAAQVGIVAPILLLVLRVVQGFALGGEWAGAVLLIRLVAACRSFSDRCCSSLRRA